MAGFELLEHTADVGIRARGATLEEAFEQATLGLAEVLGALAPGGSGGPPGWSPGRSGGSGGPPGWSPGRSGGSGGPGEAVAVEVSAPDPGGLLVDWLNEVLWLRETRDAWLAGVQVDRVGEGTAAGSVRFSSQAPAGEGAPGDPVPEDGSRDPAPDGTFVKAVTYHRLRVEPGPAGGWLIEVYLDV